MALVMYDAIDVSQFAGLTMDAAAGYVDGAWPTFRTLGQHVPRGTTLVSISVFGNPADCIDVEPGDATNNQGAAWARRRIDGGHWKPIVYTSASNVTAMTNALRAAGVRRDQIRLWSAHYAGRHICSPSVCGFPQADGTQWTSQAHGRNLDQSELENNFFQQAPNPGDDPMICAFTINDNQQVFEINAAGDLWFRAWSARDGWAQARRLAQGEFTGSPTMAVRAGGRVWDVYCQRRAGGVIIYTFNLDQAPPRNWVRTSLTQGVR